VHERRVDRVGHVELGAIAVGGDQHAADRIDEGADAVAEEFRAHRIAQRRQVLAPAQHGQRLLLLDSETHLFHGGVDGEETGFAQFFRVAQVELAHQSIEAVEVVAHRQGGHTVDAGLQKFLRLPFSYLIEKSISVLVAAAAEQQRQQAGQQQARAAVSDGDQGKNTRHEVSDRHIPVRRGSPHPGHA